MADRSSPTMFQRFYTPVELGLNSVTLAAERTSNPMDCRQLNDISLFIDFTRSSATDVTVKWEATPDDPLRGTPVWYTVKAESLAAGVGTLSTYSQVNGTGATEKFTFHGPNLNARQARIKISGTAGAAGDLAVVSAAIAMNPA